MLGGERGEGGGEKECTGWIGKIVRGGHRTRRRRRRRKRKERGLGRWISAVSEFFITMQNSDGGD